MNSIIIAFAAASLLATPMFAQAPSTQASAEHAASDAVTKNLSLAQLRRTRCASPTFANCNAGLLVVHDFELHSTVERGDTVWFAVHYNILGAVASSEASLMFFAAQRDARVDSGTVAMIRRGNAWRPLATRMPRESARASIDAVRNFFHFDADERRRLDSALKAW